MKKRIVLFFIIIATLLSIIFSAIFFIYQNESKKITKKEAIAVLDETLKTKGLKFLVIDEVNYNEENVYKIRAFYDEGDHITTKGIYIVLTESCEVYKFNMLGEGYEKIE